MDPASCVWSFPALSRILRHQPQQDEFAVRLAFDDGIGGTIAAVASIRLGTVVKGSLGASVMTP
jgi:hypothetical protein